MFVHTAFYRSAPIHVERIGRQSYYRQPRMCGVVEFADSARRFPSVHDGHLYIHKNERILARRRSPNFIDGDPAVCGGIYLESQPLENFRFYLEIDLVVVYEQDLFVGEIRVVSIRRASVVFRKPEPERDGERATRSDLARDFYMSAHRFGYMLGNGKPQPRAVNAAERRILFALERFEYARKHFGRYTYPVVCDLEFVCRELFDAGVALGNGNGDVSAVFGIRNGVARKMRQQLFELVFVAEHGVVSDCAFQFDGYVFLFCSLRDRSTHFTHQFGHRTLRFEKRHVLRFRIRKRENFIHEIEHLLTRLFYPVKIAAQNFGIVYIIACEHCESEYRVERRAHIVRHVGKKRVFCHSRVAKRVLENLLVLNLLQNFDVDVAVTHNELAYALAVAHISHTQLQIFCLAVLNTAVIDVKSRRFAHLFDNIFG